MKLKAPPQPVVFRFRGPTALCGAVEEIYKLASRVPSDLCKWRGAYYLQVGAGLGERRRLAAAAKRYGDFLGVCPVFYAFCREHGREISGDAVAKLGGALRKDSKDGAE